MLVGWRRGYLVREECRNKFIYKTLTMVQGELQYEYIILLQRDMYFIYICSNQSSYIYSWGNPCTDVLKTMPMFLLVIDQTQYA